MLIYLMDKWVIHTHKKIIKNHIHNYSKQKEKQSRKTWEFKLDFSIVNMNFTSYAQLKKISFQNALCELNFHKLLIQW